MDYFEFLNRTHKALRDLCDTHPEKDEFHVLAAEAWRRLVADTPLVFAQAAPGYLRIGVEGKAATLADPGLAGLGDAWRIFLNGVTAGDTLHASTLDGSPSGKALDNRLRTAATWVEMEARCPELAQAMRSPSIVVGRDGSIRHNPPRHRTIQLFID
ncbi:MAG TPA: hypothetical protein VJ654_20380 [Noviherbaspirillum sp.]|nr:hypothetical protein [Noviherbaspirillum sp.]